MKFISFYNISVDTLKRFIIKDSDIVWATTDFLNENTISYNNYVIITRK